MVAAVHHDEDRPRLVRCGRRVRENGIELDHVIDDDVEAEGEDTLTTLTNYVNAMDEQIDKSSVIQIFKSLYVEAQEV